MDIRDEVKEIDNRYRGLLVGSEVRPGRPWWEARIPVLAGEELTDDFANSYGVTVTVVQ
ncbi:hypothetical protein EV651_11584 [Kribbella sp. VKM Ac-2571]|nr:hypothetical protein EV651_11584 [Kribbella sp. VKM Ac-2571]